MGFTPELLTKPTMATLLFIQRLENTDKPVIFNDGGKITSVTADFEHKQLTKWKSEKYRVFIWKERVHDKKNNGEIYFNHYLYRYFLVPLDKKITIKPSENRFDFGFHRVKDSLTAEKAILLLTITEEDLIGYKKN